MIRIFSQLLSKNDQRYIRWKKSLKNRPPPWNKGKNKNNDLGVKKISDTLKTKKIDNFKIWRENAKKLEIIPNSKKLLNQDEDLAFLTGLILGDGQLHGMIDTLGKRLLGKRYLRLVVPYEQIPAYYRSGNVFTLASKTEAFGISYVEAMACNLPVVTTADDSRAEIIGPAGILTDPGNVEQYAKDLELAAKTNYKNIPYTQALKFSWNKVAQKYQALINKLSIS